MKIRTVNWVKMKMKSNEASHLRSALKKILEYKPIGFSNMPISDEEKKVLQDWLDEMENQRESA